MENSSMCHSSAGQGVLSLSSALSAQYSVLSALSSVLCPQCSALSALSSALSETMAGPCHPAVTSPHWSVLGSSGQAVTVPWSELSLASALAPFWSGA